ncbi:uncharacterized protein RCC_00221 [Ramularia collo-cygni]|uniref:Uncharacterized protein n=1 Tax=Ramularia collo-cygni TaxID=112498 RepID=A0A2D3UTV5_9PEZI|nr:uncharacterized protein RCC_00221 [Ramularia collo-cygni]CZT14246.1 uncharacterized protein RCC_00221 [Ramularia collo-cygni]
MATPSPEKEDKTPVNPLTPDGSTESSVDPAPLKAGATADSQQQNEEPRESIVSLPESPGVHPEESRRDSNATQSPVSPTKAQGAAGGSLTDVAAEDIETTSTDHKPDVSAKSPTTLKIKATAPGIGEVNSVRSAEWMEQQDRLNQPDAEKLHAKVSEKVAQEATSRNFEQIMDGNIDCRQSFRDAVPKRSLKSRLQPSDSWVAVLKGADPRSTFRRVASSAVSALKPNTDAKPLDTPENEDLPEPTLVPEPQTWLTKLIADYPGGLEYDLGALLYVFLWFIVLPFTIGVCIITTSIYFYPSFEPPCSYRPVSTLATLGSSFNLPNFCDLGGDYITPSTSPIVMDPLGITQALDWPITIPDLKRFDYAVSNPAKPFTPISDNLHQSAAFIAQDARVKTISQYATKRVAATQTLQKSTTALVSRYNTLINDILHWSSRAPKDMQTLAQSSYGFWDTVSLLWGPTFGLKTPLGSIKEKLRLPVEELFNHVKNLAVETRRTSHAIKIAKNSRVEFHRELAEAEEFFVDRCLSRNLLGYERLSAAAACQGWDPRVIEKALVKIEKREDVLFDAIQTYVEAIVGSVKPLGMFYKQVLEELEGVKSRTFGDVTFDTLDSLRAFVGSFEERIGVAAGDLGERMSREVK